MKTIAIITARGGSKRIPKKNIKFFAGKPVIAYAIEACIESGIFDEVMVSTDCLEIAEISKQSGANIPFLRSEKTSDDFATTYDALEEVIYEYKKQGKEFEIICCIYPCVPLLKSNSLTEAYAQMQEKDANAIMPVCKYPVPIEWAMKLEDGVLIPNDREALNIRSQDIETKYFDVGMFYFCKKELMLKYKSLVPENTLGYIIDESQCQDIDTEEDWKIAEMKYKIIKVSMKKSKYSTFKKSNKF